MRKKTSIIIEENLWHSFKLDCIKRKVEVSSTIEELIKKHLKGEKK